MTKFYNPIRLFLHPKLLLFLLLVSLFALLPSCDKTVDYFDYVSELRRDIFIAKTDDLSLRIYAVEKEVPYEMDGIKKELSTRVEAYLVAPEGDKTCNFTFSFQGKEYGGEMSFDNVKTEYYYACTLDIDGASELPCRIQYGEEEFTLTATTVRAAETLTPRNVLKTLEGAEAELFSSLTDKYGFAGEIQIRLIYEDAPYYYVGVIDRNNTVHAFLINANTGKILAKRTS